MKTQNTGGSADRQVEERGKNRSTNNNNQPTTVQTKRSRVMNGTTYFSRALAALVSIILMTGLMLGQNLNLNGSGGTLAGTWNVKGNISTSTATGIYTFSGTMNLNGTGATLTQSVGAAGATKALIFANLNATGTKHKALAGTATVSTAFVQNNSAGQNFVVGANTLSFGGTTTLTSGTFDATSASSTVNYTSGSAQTVLSSTYGGTLGLSGAGAKSLGGNVTAALVSHTASSGALTVDNNLTIDGSSASSLDAITVNSTKILDVTGTGGATITTLTANNGTIRKTTNSGTITFSNAVSTAGTITASAGALTFSGNAEAATGGTISLTSSATANFAGNLSTSGTGTLSFGGTSQVNFTSASAQSIVPTTFYNLTMSGGGAKTFSGTTNVTISSGGTFDNGSQTSDFTDRTLTSTGATLTQAAGGTVKFGGATNGVVFSTGTVDYNGSDAVTQTITAGTYANIVLSRSSGTGTAAKEIASAATVTTTGNMTISANTGLTLVASSSTLTVQGDLSIDGGVTNNGTINVGN